MRGSSVPSTLLRARKIAKSEEKEDFAVGAEEPILSAEGAERVGHPQVQQVCSEARKTQEHRQECLCHKDQEKPKKK
jgi:hypothetical protein